MRKVSYLSYNMTTADANNPDGIVPVGRQFDFIGDVETEEMILVDGDESLCLGYTGVDMYEDVYVGDMMEYKATLTNVGNSSRDCHIEVFKLATPAYRAGKAKEDCVQGEMVWFDEPVLCSSGNVRLVVKKHLQRGEQPDGKVEDPWRPLEDFPEDADLTDVNDITFRYRMSDRDVFYSGGVVNGARNLTLMEDTAKRLMAREFGNTGHITRVEKVRLYEPCAAGDYIEYRARVKKVVGDKIVIEVRNFKIIELPENPPYPSSIDVLPEPRLCTVVQYVFETYKK